MNKTAAPAKLEPEVTIASMRILNDRVLVEVIEKEKETSSKILLPGKLTGNKDSLEECLVLKIGKSEFDEHGIRELPDFEVGSHVLVDAYAGTDLIVEGRNVRVLTYHDIQSVVAQPQAAAPAVKSTKGKAKK